jgi:TolB-like protein
MADEQASDPAAVPGRDVFISYASHDKAVAEAVCRALEDAGLACWIAPRDVVPGESFAAAIVHAIDSTKVIVLVLSEHAADSQHVLREVERATSKRHAVIAFRLDMKPLPADFEYFLNTSQWLDASTTGVRRALPKLVEAVRGATGPASAAPGAVPEPAVATAAKVRWRPALIGIVALVLTIGAYMLRARIHNSKPTTATVATAQTSMPIASEKSIAVLPFVDMSEKHDQEYFSDGLTEELINQLAQLPDFKVIARTSSFAFKNRAEDVSTIARRLNVRNVLEGSVRKAGLRLRVTAQLIRADNGTHIWSKTYDRDLRDVFAVQNDLARSVVDALKVSFADRTSLVQTRPTRNLEAYDNYLLGKKIFEGSTNLENTKKAYAYLEKAIQLDPNFGLAHLELANAASIIGDSELAYRAIAEREAETAIRLSPELPDAYLLRESLRMTYHRDWHGAAADLKKAAELAPGSAAVWKSYSFMALTLGDCELGLRLARKAAELDPENPGRMTIAYNLRGLKRYEEARELLQELLLIAPGDDYASLLLGLIEIQQSHPDRALALIEHRDQWVQSTLESMAYFTQHKRTESDQALQELLKTSSENAAYQIAEIYAWRAEDDQALSWLERALAQSDGGMFQLKSDPVLDGLRTRPRFERIVEDYLKGADKSILATPVAPVGSAKAN